MEERDKLLAQLQSFTEKLNREPDPSEFEPTLDGSARTLPISFIEMTLDELFYGQWSLDNPTYQQVFNEVIGTAVLTVIHPISNIEIKRVGFASIVITQDAKSTLADFNTTKKKNALDLAFPKLKAEILKNAALSLGKRFGRDINRKRTDTFKRTLTTIPFPALEAAVERIEKGESKDMVMALCESNFILTKEDRELLINAQPKQLNGRS